MMISDTAFNQWQPLGDCNPKDLIRSRGQLHQAMYFLQAVGKAYVPPQPDDSHTSTTWSANEHMLIGNHFGKDRQVRLGLQLENMKLVLLDCNSKSIDEFSLSNGTMSSAQAWLSTALEQQGFKTAQLEIDGEHRMSPGSPAGREQFNPDHQAQTELSKYYSNADLLLQSLVEHLSGASPVRCWPHHFDIATLVTIEQDRSIGIGLSPGDSSYDEPYFYITPWPYPDINRQSLPPLPVGSWYTDQWVGAILISTDIIKSTPDRDQLETCMSFLQSGINANYELMDLIPPLLN